MSTEVSRLSNVKIPDGQWERGVSPVNSPTTREIKKVYDDRVGGRPCDTSPTWSRGKGCDHKTWQRAQDVGGKSKEVWKAFSSPGSSPKKGGSPKLPGKKV